jgi:putative CocE/NonD family hydrolase
MRDGVRLFTAVYLPKAATFQDPGPYPVLITRTPNSVAPYGKGNYPSRLGPSEEFETAGYIFVYQDARGRFMSEGTFVEMRPHMDVKKSPKDVDDSTDMRDTIDFLLRNVANNNGAVGIVGISYAGFHTSASIIDSHPAIKAASPQAPLTDLFLFDDAYHGGAFMLAANFSFYTGFGPMIVPTARKPPASFAFGTDDLYAFYLNAGATSNLDKEALHGQNWLFHDQLVHDTYDEYWQVRDISRHMKNINCAVMTVGGWFDAEDLSGPFRTFHAIDQYSPGIVNTLVVGPWTHGEWAEHSQSEVSTLETTASQFFRAEIQFPFFQFYLKRKGSIALPKAYVFETGRNVWRKYDTWPPRDSVPTMLYLRAGGRLRSEPPGLDEGDHDEYLSDPAHPVPFMECTGKEPKRYMTADQRFASHRPDVLVYQTEPLTEDLTIVGPVSPRLWISSSGTDSDFVVKLIDVYPIRSSVPDHSAVDESNPDSLQLRGGYQQMVRGEPMRAKFRNSWEKPEPLIPSERTEVSFSMPDVNHTFLKGHRIMVQVQSSWFPLVDRNPQTFTDIPFARPEQFVKAQESVYHSHDAPSRIEVMVLR